MKTTSMQTPHHTTRSGKDRRFSDRSSSLVLLRLPDVMALCGLSRSAIYAAIQRDTFPRPVTLNAGRARAWIKGEVVEWMEQCIQNSRSDAPEPRQRPSR
jgi:prophage regulatory protein